MEKKTRLIDANEAKNIIKANDWSNPTVPVAVNLIIDSVTTVEAKPIVHARWEFRRNERQSWCTDAVCTACETIIDTHVDNDVEYRQEAIQERLLYCPHCGAQMDAK